MIGKFIHGFKDEKEDRFVAFRGISLNPVLKKFSVR
jgi:hypothetical protein